MRLAIHQPLYLPYYGFFQKAAQADIFVFLDNVQYSNNNWQDYNTIKTPQGPYRLRVPLDAHFGEKICEVRTKDELGWKQKHIKTISMNYRRAKHFGEVSEAIFDIISSRHESLAALNMALCEEIIKRLDITTKIVRASDLNATGRKESLVINICRQLGATEYLSGKGAAAYQSAEHFNASGIDLTYMEGREPDYHQLWGNHVQTLSFIDYLMNAGFTIPAEWGEENGL